jgi:hypothetical protein
MFDDVSMKPIVFISYAQVDEPEKPADGEVQWLSFVRRHLQPGVKSGADHDAVMEAKLNACDIFILLVSPASMASDWVEKEIAIIRARQARGEPVHFYPLVLMPTPRAGLDKVMDKNLRPASAKPFSGCDAHDRARYMTDAADEIASIAAELAKRKRAAVAAPAVGLARRSAPGKIAGSGPAMTAAQSVQAKSRYAAFVCYRHLPEDRRWAEWLIEALRDFETPEELVRRGVPSRIGTLFRDDKEMAVKADLAGYIKQALWDSEHLIVVCSATTPTSDWVRAEISLFKYWGRAERIHALLIDAEVEQAFPAELRYWRIAGEGPQAVMEMAEPAAASVAPVKGQSEAESKALARDKLAAALLGCDLAELRDALARRERAMTTYRYFEQMVSRRAVPEGVGEVPPGHVPHRKATLRFESRGGRVERISRINGLGSLRDNNEGVAQWDVTWRGDGSVESIELRNRLGRLVTRRSFNRDATQVDFSTEAETAHAQGPAASVLKVVADEAGFGKSEIVRHLLDYDENGYVIGRRYARDQFNTPAEDTFGNWGEGYARDARGLASRTWFLGPNGTQKIQRNGVNHFTEIFDAHARLLEQASFDADGKPALDKDGRARTTRIYDTRSNRIEWACFGVDGNPVLDKDGCAKFTNGYDARGNIVEQAYFGIDGEPVLHKDSYARSTWAYDARGNIIERACFGVDGNPVLDKNGYARTARTYDARGYEIEWACFGVDGEPVLHKDGYTRVTYSYDARGNVIEWAYFGVDGEPVLLRDGYARATSSYDVRGNVVEVTYLGIDGNPVLDKDGCAKFTNGYDARGNIVEQAYFGIDGEPALHKDGYARSTWAYDARGNIVERACFGVDGEPVLREDGYTRVTYGYDSRGNEIERAYFGIDAKPALHKDGYARITYLYNARGNVVEEAFFGVDGEPVLREDGYTRVTYGYDARGNDIERAYFGVDGEPTLHKDGYARVTYVFNTRGNAVQVAYFGVDGEPVLHKDGGARSTWAYDARGNVVEWAYFGLDGKPTLLQHGYARAISAYDTRGHAVEVAYFGVDGEPVLHKDGYARSVRTCDARGNVVEVACFGVNGKPVLDKDGCARWTNVYDARGNRIEQAYFGVEGKPVLDKDGYARVTSAFDARGNRIEQAYFGVDSAPIIFRAGYHKRRVEVDPLGRLLRVRYFDVDGEKVARRNLLLENDHIGDLLGPWRVAVLSGLLTTDEIEAVPEGGFHEAIYAYDARGDVVERRFSDIDGAAALGPNGFSVEEIAYDALGRPVRFSSRRPDDDARALSVAIRYDARGNAVAVEYLDQADRPVNGAQGFAKAELTYNQFGDLLSVRHLKADGTPIPADDDVAVRATSDSLAIST